MRHQFYRRDLPRDLLDTFQRNDQEMVRHLIGEEAYDSARQLNCMFYFLVGAWDMNRQTVDTVIVIDGADKDVLFWLIKYAK